MGRNVLELRQGEPRGFGVNLAALLERLARGDQTAMAELYDRTRARVYGLALRITGTHTGAEEATLDAYTQAWRTAASYSAERGSVLAWLLTLVRTRAIDLLRATAADRRHEPLEAARDTASELRGPPQMTEFDEDARQVRVALDALPTAQREAIVSAYFGGLSHSGIARRLGVPLGTIKTRIRMGMATLRRALAHAPGETQ